MDSPNFMPGLSALRQTICFIRSCVRRGQRGWVNVFVDVLMTMMCAYVCACVCVFVCMHVHVCILHLHGCIGCVCVIVFKTFYIFVIVFSSANKRFYSQQVHVHVCVYMSICIYGKHIHAHMTRPAL
jgi:hypothetical protein